MNSAEMIALAERVEGLSGPDTGMDKRIRLATMEDGREKEHWRKHLIYMTAPSYTFSLDAAMTLVPEGWGYTLVKAPGHKFEAVVREWQQDAKGKFWTGKHMAHSSEVVAASMPLAIVSAALRAHSTLSTGDETRG